MRYVRVKPAALKAMLEHGKSQIESGLEVGGVITGREENSSVLVTHAIPLSIGQKTTVEITPEHFAEAYKKKEESGIEDPIIGWYHSHPGYSCFMSGTDEKAHRKLLNLYKDAIALVLDPVLYSDRKPSSEYFKVFTLSDGEVTEIPSDIDGSRESKDNMFRGFVSGKETVIERVVIERREGRSWAQIASVALLALILVLGMAGYTKLGEIEDTVSSARDIDDTISQGVQNVNNQIPLMNERMGKLEENYEDITEKLGSIEDIVRNYDFELENPKEISLFLREDTEFAITVVNTGNVENEFSVEIPEFPGWFKDPPSPVYLERGKKETIIIHVPESFRPTSLKNPVHIVVTDIDLQENSKEIIVNLIIKPRVTFKVNSISPEQPLLTGNTFEYSYQLDLGEDEYILEIAADPGNTKIFNIEFPFGEDLPPEIIYTEDDELLDLSKPLPLQPKETITLKIKPGDIEGFTLVITIKDEQSGEQYILTLTLQKGQESSSEG